ncbi:MAG TPA: FtsK/SpoIIIE domain-containing protein [Anaerolineales bacterium]|nr:FtsK/SpoIIIE domain-containing protein [Anaerolineales bacterium]
MKYQKLQQTLAQNSQRINAVFAAHHVDSQVRFGNAHGRTLRFALSLSPKHKLRDVTNLRDELALALDTPNVQFSRENGQLTLDILNPERKQILVRDVLKNAEPIPSATACLGEMSDGRPLLLRLENPNSAHVLIAGTTGSGKSELLRSMLWSLATCNRQAHLQLALVDPKQRGFLPFTNAHNLCSPIAVAPNDIENLLEKLVALMEKRDRLQEHLPRIVVAVDELAEVVHTCGEQALLALTRLAQRGRQAGIHLLLATQQPSSALLGSALKANLPVRLVGKVNSAEDARMASGMGGTNAEFLHGQGDFVAINAGRQTRFQAAVVTMQEWNHFG